MPGALPNKIERKPRLMECKYTLKTIGPDASLVGLLLSNNTRMVYVKDKTEYFQAITPQCVNISPEAHMHLVRGENVAWLTVRNLCYKLRPVVDPGHVKCVRELFQYYED